jgi:hypothetical protein
MKILCLGRKGDSRSAALAWLLKQKGHDAIAVGMRCMGSDTRKMMLDWSDKIILLHEKCGEGVPEEYWSKLKIWEVGRDTYMRNFDPLLVERLVNNIEKEGL